MDNPTPRPSDFSEFLDLLDFLLVGFCPYIIPLAWWDLLWLTQAGAIDWLWLAACASRDVQKAAYRRTG
jgi:hypothetical protein